MAAGAAQLQRSFSYGPDDHANHHENEEGSFIGQRRSARKQSIVGSLWNLLYAKRSSSSNVVEQQDETDHTAESATKQEDAWMQAYYNGVVLVALLVVLYLCWAVYCVLEPFLHPLLWSVLIGTLLHPFKKTWTEKISRWLDLLEDNSIPLSAGLFLSPFFFFNSLSNRLESTIVTYSWAILGAAVGVASLWLIYKLSLPLHLYRALAAVHSFVFTFEKVLTTYTGPLQLVTITVGFVVLLILMSRSGQRYSLALTSLSILVWFLAVLNVASYVVGSTVALPLVTGLFVIGAAISSRRDCKGPLEWP